MSDAKTLEELKERGKRAFEVPRAKLSQSEEGLAIAYWLLLDAEDGRERVNLRDIGWDLLPHVYKCVRPYLSLVEVRLRELGYVRVSKYGWRKWSEVPPWEQIRQVVERMDLDDQEAYVLYVAWRLLRITDPAKIDWKGFNFFHAFAIRDRLLKPQNEFTKEDVEWIRERLVKYYRNQIREMGLSFDLLLPASGAKGNE